MGRWSLLCCRSSVTPRHQFIEASDLVIGDATEHIGQPYLWIEAVQLGSFDERVGDCTGILAAFRADEKIIFPAQSDTTNRSKPYVCVTGIKDRYW